MDWSLGAMQKPGMNYGPRTQNFSLRRQLSDSRLSPSTLRTFGHDLAQVKSLSGLFAVDFTTACVLDRDQVSMFMAEAFES